jgi:CheY-like chemotaxis protein
MTRVKRIVLIHFEAALAARRRALLGRAGYTVEVYAPRSAAEVRPILDHPPDAIVVDLSARPSNGHGAAVTFRQRKATRRVPMVLVGGEASQVRRLQGQLPDVPHAEWRRIRGVLTRALRHPPEDPHVPVAMALYSGAPLARKLGIRSGTTVALLGAPRAFESQLGDVRRKVVIKKQARGQADNIVLFVRTRAELRRRLPSSKRMLADGGSLWIAWPKKTSGLSRDLSQQAIRAIGMAAGMVDYKICAIDETWSGLRFARRKTGRSAAAKGDSLCVR